MAARVGNDLHNSAKPHRLVFVSANTTPQASPSSASKQPGKEPSAPLGAPVFSPVVGRIPIMDVTPCVEKGRLAAKGTEHEAFPVQATVFREGHDRFAAEAVLVDPEGNVAQIERMVNIRPGLGRYEAWLTPTYPGAWSFYVQAWSDPWATWEHNARIKVAAASDIELVFLEAEDLLRRAIGNLEPRSPQAATLIDTLSVVSRASTPAPVRLAAATSPAVDEIMTAHPLRDLLTRSEPLPLAVDRLRALVGSWYEIFPRSCGAYQKDDGTWVSGTLRTAARELDRISSMGFDVVYLTPIHPIGTTSRKGRNNTLVALPGDPGSPYAIGSPDGGHDAIHPELGTFDDFDAFVARAHELGMEVALDLALQCSPDHPWLTEHPEWFTTRADGTIAYAENPPKKYQDIYPLNFDNDPEGIYDEIVRILKLWVSHGVTIFRVDNPHTKPVAFWERLLAQFRVEHPDVIFLAEAFTAPPMLQGLGAVGFHQSYCYFAWRNEKEEIEEYLEELARESDDRVRPAFWPTTHDILTPYMQHGGTAGFAIRAVLAATGSPTYGIYSGYELAERIPRPGFEEQIDNEKYEFKPRDWEAAEPTGIPHLLGELNAIRHKHTALQRLRNIRINPTSDPNIVCFTRFSRPEESPDGTADAVIVAINLDPSERHSATVSLDLSPWDLTPRPDGKPLFEVTDELSGFTYSWDENPTVILDPSWQFAHILSVKVLS
ncbi:DUF3416 domain-containing protein [Arcanobacterium haemolyticum]|nr:DUF3416 domain-containing protein [Arcanobacterium haemolyticum]